MSKSLPFFIAMAVTLSTPVLFADAPMASISFPHPVSPAADVNNVYIAGPYCDGQPGDLTRGVYDITSGSPVLYSLIPTNPFLNCFEPTIALANGLGGFTAGWLYVAYPDPVVSGRIDVGKIAPTGPLPRPIQPVATLNSAGAFLSMSFDRVGTFGNKLILLTGTGALFTIDSTGAVATINTNIPQGFFEYENPTVAPLTFGPYGGWLWFVSESQQQAFALSPVTLQTVTLPFAFSPPQGLESPTFIENAPVCKIKGGNVVLAHFVGFAQGVGNVLFFDTTSHSDIQGLMHSEDTGLLNVLNPDGTNGGSFYTAGDFFESSTTVTARTDTPGCQITRGCTLTQGGYKNNFNSKVLNFPLGSLYLGSVKYTNKDLNDILQNNAIKGNGLLSLAHQLITAKLNIYYGAQPTLDVALAIVNADALIGSLIVPPVGSGSLDPSKTSALESILDDFNNGVTGPGHCK